MAPFSAPSVVVRGFKERAEALTVQGDRLYVGTSTGNLHIYTLSAAGEEAQFLETKKALSRRAIEHMGFLKDVNSLAVLTDSLVTLYPLPAFAPPTPLTKTKGALSFATYTGIVYGNLDGKSQPSSDGDFGKAKEVPSVVTYLAVGCRRKIVLYSWKDGEPQDVQEATLPHSPRSMTFLNNNVICFGYMPTDFAVFSIKTFSTIEFTAPLSPTTSGVGISTKGMGALSGLGGYMTLGLGAKARPCLINISDNEALVAKDNNGIFLGLEGKVTRSTNIDWPAPPEDLAFVKPYIFSIMPPGSVPASQAEGSISGAAVSQPSFIPSPVIDIRSSLSLLPVQTLPFPPTSEGISSHHHIVRLLTASSTAKSPLYLVTTPTDRATAAVAGSSIWEFRMKTWNEQIDELVEEGSYENALAILDSIDPAVLPDKDRRQRQVQALHAVSQFRATHYDDAINTFIDLDINPAKVVALYPESVAGRLSVPQDAWIPLFGGPKCVVPPPVEDLTKEGEGEGSVTTGDVPLRAPSPKGSVLGVLKTGLESVTSVAQKDDDTSSISGTGKRKEIRKDDFHRSVESLMRYLSECRRKATGALEALSITSAQSHRMPYLSATSIDELFGLPNAPLSALTPEELVRFAQIVDTALFKSYLLVRPGLLAPLCRQPNWCEVSEVEEVLQAREKFSELIYLYNGRKMHGKALDLLRQLSEKETDTRDKLMPSVTYLQRLGPENMEQIFEYSRWLFDRDSEIALEIFTSEEAELPRQRVAEFLEKIDLSICARYLEYLIDERSEESSLLHDRLAELYLRMAMSAKKQGNEDLGQTAYAKLLRFIDTTDHYQVDRVFGLLPSEDLFEAKAILLGRLGRHDSALEIYVYRLEDYTKAEAYCKRVYKPGSETSNVFLTLLRTYLRPTSPRFASADLLQPALALISRHGPRLDSVETLQLLPPLVATADVRDFLRSALRAPILDTRVVREIAKAREDQITRRLMALQTKRVRVTDSRICPQCHKRIGHSVIAVHAPRGEVTHYQCREAFSKKLKDLSNRS
ncbi:Vacuolar morphogenesis protein [Sparassis crispa]|uniref:Vacuolar morphogenesis protein n=1 Tax=Sparassis crispa TaxID=139825 RepID=A0A401H033_9APHY|nr:Vacuolar morphogenesis protein [Sparassis crispa]GBE87785.1 Vacuolar morphogenesis protein [Sparassis crispa]